MKIGMINGQNRKGGTYHVGRMLAEKLATDAEIIEFFLTHNFEHFCLGFYQCIEDVTKCPYYPEKKAILDAMEQAELMNFTTPNYCFGLSAQMKAMIDRFRRKNTKYKPGFESPFPVLDVCRDAQIRMG